MYILFSKWYEFPNNDEIERERIDLFDDDKFDINDKFSETKNKYINYLQNNAVALAHNKGQHTPPRYGQRNANTFVYQSYCFFYDIVTSHYAL